VAPAAALEHLSGVDTRGAVSSMAVARWEQRGDPRCLHVSCVNAQWQQQSRFYAQVNIHTQQHTVQQQLQRLQLQHTC